MEEDLIKKAEELLAGADSGTDECIYYNDAFIDGVRFAIKALRQPTVSGSVPIPKCKCGQNTLPYKAHIEIEKCSRCGNDR